LFPACGISASNGHSHSSTSFPLPLTSRKKEIRGECFHLFTEQKDCTLALNYGRVGCGPFLSYPSATIICHNQEMIVCNIDHLIAFYEFYGLLLGVFPFASTALDRVILVVSLADATQRCHLTQGFLRDNAIGDA
jgi:hypothetical protein